jgi:hypothetical protein
VSPAAQNDDIDPINRDGTLTIGSINARIVELLDGSLVTRGSSSNFYSMHRLIQAALLSGLQDSERVRLFKITLEVIDHFFPQYDDSDRLLTSWPECGQILPHVSRLAQLYLNSQLHDTPTYLQLGELLERSSWSVVTHS